MFIGVLGRACVTVRSRKVQRVTSLQSGLAEERRRRSGKLKTEVLDSRWGWIGGGGDVRVVLYGSWRTVHQDNRTVSKRLILLLCTYTY